MRNVLLAVLSVGLLAQAGGWVAVSTRSAKTGQPLRAVKGAIPLAAFGVLVALVAVALVIVTLTS
jgi:hypothetical protein